MKKESTFGFPVLPLVYNRKRGSSASTHSTSHLVEKLGTTSCHQTSLPSCHLVSSLFMADLFSYVKHTSAHAIIITYSHYLQLYILYITAPFTSWSVRNTSTYCTIFTSQLRNKYNMSTVTMFLLFILTLSISFCECRIHPTEVQSQFHWKIACLL